MLFNSSAFIVLLAITFALYYFPLFSKYQVQILILSSLAFYAYSQPWLVLLLLFSVTVNIISSYYVVYGKQEYRKLFATSGVVLNLSILVFFKYSALLVNTFTNNPNSIGDFLINLPLPIGISFFTFQGISLVVDVYTQKYKSNTELVPISFATHTKQILFFKAFFPQLISGPIVKAHDFIPQIKNKALRDIDWESFFKSIVVGYFLKMVVADNLKDFTFWIAYPYFKNYSSLTLLIMLFGYSCQIFADFAGYSLIAIGLAKLFGYAFPANFNFPYISTSFREFWKRWHISLSSFLMEYLYIPLGGNKKGELRKYFNLMLVMLLGGLWHGAAWSYALWGGFHGTALCIERWVSARLKLKQTALLIFLKGVMVFCFITMAWLLFKLPRIEDVFQFVQSLYSNIKILDDTQLIVYILLYSSPVWLYHLAYLMKSREVFYLRMRKMEYLFYGSMIFLMVVNSGSPGSFIYFQF